MFGCGCYQLHRVTSGWITHSFPPVKTQVTKPQVCLLHFYNVKSQPSVSINAQKECFGTYLFSVGTHHGISFLPLLQHHCWWCCYCYYGQLSLVAINQAWDMSTKRQISMAVKLTFRRKKNCLRGKEIGGTKKKEKENKKPLVLVLHQIFWGGGG